jgi:hypothetical protein
MCSSRTDVCSIKYRRLLESGMLSGEQVLLGISQYVGNLMKNSLKWRNKRVIFYYGIQNNSGILFSLKCLSNMLLPVRRFHDIPFLHDLTSRSGLANESAQMLLEAYTNTIITLHKHTFTQGNVHTNKCISTLHVYVYIHTYLHFLSSQ